MMKKILLFLGLLVISLFIIVGCAPPSGGEDISDEELFDDQGAIAGQATLIGCSIFPVSSCTDSEGTVTAVKRVGIRTTTTTTFTKSDSCVGSDNSMAVDYSCLSSTQIKVCRNSCTTGEVCQAGRCVLCGNQHVDIGETCSSCPEDAGCTDGQVCQSGVCEVVVAPPSEQNLACEYLACGSIVTITAGDVLFDNGVISEITSTGVGVNVGEVITIMNLGEETAIPGILSHDGLAIPGMLRVLNINAEEATLCISEDRETGFR